MLDAPVTRGFELAQVHLPGRLIRQEVQLEVAAVALPAQPLAHRERPLSRERALAFRQHVGEHVVAAPPAVVRRELGEPGELRHQRAHQRAVTGDDAFDRALARVDPPHHLDVVADDLLLLRLPVTLVGDEERGLPGIAVRRLHDEVVAELRCAGELHQPGVVVRAAHGVRHARHARVVAELRRDDLRVQPVSERGRRERHLEAELAGELLGLLVEHQERGLAPRATPADEVRDLLVSQQVVADLLDRAELARPLLAGHEDVRMGSVERVVVVQELEVAHPPVDPEQVERRRRDEVDGLLVRPEEAADVGDAAERSLLQRRPPRATRKVPQVGRPGTDA